MKIGNLKYRITIQKPAVLDDGQGGRVRTFADWKTVWADIRPPKASNAIYQGDIVSKLTIEILIRQISDNLVGCKVVHGSKEYMITSSYDDRFGGTVLLTQEIVRSL